MRWKAPGATYLDQGRNGEPPPLASGILAGVTRTVVMELCAGTGVRVNEARITPAQLRRADGVFFWLEISWGIVEAGRWDHKRLNCSPLTKKLQMAYRRLLAGEVI